jgi:P-type conjugative transfer protein TrbJ
MTIRKATVPRKRRRRDLLLSLAIAAGLTAAFDPVREALACWYDPIILDPTALVEHVEQVAQMALQVASAVQQVKNQLQQLQHLNASVTIDPASVVSGLRGQLDASLYDTSSLGGQLDSRFPADMSGTTWDQLQSSRATWVGNERQALAENRQLQNQVYRDMASTRSQVQGIVEASNSAPGETAAAQAHNDLLAVASGELTKLASLKAVRARLRTETQAREQSELSFAAAEQKRVRTGWENPAPPTGGVVNAFASVDLVQPQ